MNCKRVDLASQDVFFLLLLFFVAYARWWESPKKIGLLWLDLLFLFRIIVYCYGWEVLTSLLTFVPVDV